MSKVFSAKRPHIIESNKSNIHRVGCLLQEEGLDRAAGSAAETVMLHLVCICWRTSTGKIVAL